MRPEIAPEIVKKDQRSVLPQCIVPPCGRRDDGFHRFAAGQSSAWPAIQAEPAAPPRGVGAKPEDERIQLFTGDGSAEIRPRVESSQ